MIDNENCICGDNVGSGGWTCRHGGACTTQFDIELEKSRSAAFEAGSKVERARIVSKLRELSEEEEAKRAVFFLEVGVERSAWEVIASTLCDAADKIELGESV